MAHFAEIDENNIVLSVIVVGDDDLIVDGEESEEAGINFLKKTYARSNPNGRWVQTSYNANMRGEYASIGGSYDETKDVFISLQPYPSWILDTDNKWQPPVPNPETGEPPFYRWDEDTTSWVEIEFTDE
jgi:hypothetical protein|tara:strand:+ start:1732 stop:2118 length:387 start_codon:yes stop_codon:yes gene_type:complete